MMMRSDGMERIVVLPFSMGCVSHSSIQVSSSTPDPLPLPCTKSKSSPPRPRLIFPRRSDGACKVKNVWGGLVSLPKPNVSYGIQKLVTTFKSFSRFFVYKEEDEEEEVEVELEIGLPTDVKHVTHIGWDGSTINNNKIHDHLSFPSISLQQFHLAMAAQSHHPHLHLNNN